MNSIVQGNPDVCFLCGGNATWEDTLDTHHCFGGALRKKSEADGLIVKLHHKECHQYGKNAVHNNRGNMDWVKQQAQIAYMDLHGTTIEDFIKEYGRNYI